MFSENTPQLCSQAPAPPPRCSALGVVEPRALGKSFKVKCVPSGNGGVMTPECRIDEWPLSTHS